VIIPEFTNNKDEYLLFEPITNQVSHAPNPAINKIELATFEKASNGLESTAWKYIMQEKFNSLIKN
jgi:hypothetical protein